MQSFDKKVQVTKKDSEYTISVAISDNCVITKTITKNELEQLYNELHVLLQDEE